MTNQRVFKIGIVTKLIFPLSILFAAIVFITAIVLLNVFSSEQLKMVRASAQMSAAQSVMTLDKGVSLEKLRGITTNTALDDNVNWVTIIEVDSDDVLASSFKPRMPRSIETLPQQMYDAYFSAKRSRQPYFSSVQDNGFAFAFPVSGLDQSKMSTTDLILLVQYNTDGMNEQFANYLNIIVLVAVSFYVGLISILVVLINIYIRQPLHKFKRVLDTESQNEAFQPIAIDTNDEFADIARAYNKMKLIERKSLQRVTQASQAAYDLAEKKSQFLANMSHELRTPINGILGLAQLCQRSTSEQDTKRYLGQLNHSSKILLSIVNDILDFSRLNEQQTQLYLESTPLSDLLQHTCNISQVMADEKALGFSINICPNAPYIIKIDKKRLEQILMNIINNAVKFTQNGTVQLSVDFDWNSKMQGNLCISVDDTGIGIAEENIQNIFDPFEQADTTISRYYGGTGLGLAICKELVELMDGVITVESEANQGTSFKVVIPCEGASLESYLVACFAHKDLPRISYSKELSTRTNSVCDTVNKFASIPRVVPLSEIVEDCMRAPYLLNERVLIEYLENYQANSLKKMPNCAGESDAVSEENHILLVEDNEINATVAQNMLLQEGYRVTVAENGKVAVFLFNNHYQQEDQFHAVLMDVQMPIMDGYEATQIIKEIDPSIPIIGLSANTMKEDHNKAMDAGMNDYLHKPIIRETLIVCLRAHLALRNSRV
ncbi:ATP-binding protein [Ningiella sp. W23]|uniref:ATP-binding protein n=1 Tax=Ningiella sp. W23 TaxID=3023715 RepID=UPI0037573A82